MGPKNVQLKSNDIDTRLQEFIDQSDLGDNFSIDSSSGKYNLPPSLHIYKNELIDISTLEIILIAKRILDAEKIPYDEIKFKKNFEKIREKISKTNQSKIYIDMNVLHSQSGIFDDKNKKYLVEVKGKTQKNSEAHGIKYNNFRFGKVNTTHMNLICIGILISKKRDPIEILINNIGDKH